MSGVFISYRHIGGFDAAHELAYRLREDGYKVFFDKTSLREGKFDEKIFDNIRRCTDFVVVFNKDVFERTFSGVSVENDWLRTELGFAIKLKKNIIPIAMPGFEWPATLPDDIADVKRHNAVPYSLDYHSSYYDRLIEHLNSRRPLKTYLGKIIVVCLAMMVIGGVWHFVSQKLTEPALVLMGGGSVMEYIQDTFEFDEKHKDYRCIYLPMPSGIAWSQITEVRSLPKQEANNYPYHLVILSAGQATDSDFFPDSGERGRFKDERGFLNEIRIGRSKLQVAISDTSLIRRHLSGKKINNESGITTQELISLLEDPNITVFRTKESSGTYKKYDSILVSSGHSGLKDLYRVEEFRREQESSMYCTPFVILESATYWADNITETQAQRYFVYDEKGKAVSNDLFVYFIVFDETEGYVVPKVVRKFLDDIGVQIYKDYDNQWKKNTKSNTLIQHIEICKTKSS